MNPFCLETPDVESDTLHKSDYTMKNGKSLTNLWKIGSITKKRKPLPAGLRMRYHGVYCRFHGEKEHCSEILNMLGANNDTFDSPVQGISYRVLLSKPDHEIRQCCWIKCLPKDEPRKFYSEAFNRPKTNKTLLKFRNYEKKPPVILVGLQKKTEEPPSKRRKTNPPVKPRDTSSTSLLLSIPSDLLTLIFRFLPRTQVSLVQQTCKYFNSLIASEGIMDDPITDEEAVSVMQRCGAEAYCSIDTGDPDSIAALIHALPVPNK